MHEELLLLLGEVREMLADIKQQQEMLISDIRDIKEGQIRLEEELRTNDYGFSGISFRSDYMN